MKRVVPFLILFLVACIPQPPIIEKQVYQIYFPSISKPADARFSMQYGWGSDCCSAELYALGLVRDGANMHRQLTDNELHGMQVKEWFDWANDPNNGHPWLFSLHLQYPPCTWTLATNNWHDTNACSQFINANRGRSFYVGNEPNCYLGCGGWYFTPQDYATHFRSVYQGIKSLDPTAKVLTAAWIYNDPCTEWQNFDGAMIESYVSRCGQFQEDGISMHYYQNTAPYVPDSRHFIDCFLAKLNSEGNLVKSNKVRITETGWSPSAGTEQDVILFMQYWFSYLETKPQIERWYFWQWADQAYLLDANGNITDVGRCYQKLASGNNC